jgi:hypothetical protein
LIQSIPLVSRRPGRAISDTIRAATMPMAIVDPIDKVLPAGDHQSAESADDEPDDDGH